MSRIVSHILAALLFMGSAADAAERRVLIPIVVRDVPGAFGTSWSTRTFAHNDSPDVATAHFPRDCPIGCAPILTFPPYSTWFLDFPVNVDATRPGRIVVATDSLRFSTQLIEASGSNSMNVPAITESSFERRLLFPRIATGGDTRRLLRVYCLNPSGGPVAVQVYRVRNDPTLPHELVTATTMMLAPSTSVFEPSYLQIGEDALLDDTEPGNVLNLEFSSMDQETLIWGS